MPNVPYIAGDNTTRQRDLVSGDGSLANPDVVRSEDPTLQALIGTQNAAAATTPTSAASVIALLKRIAQDVADTEIAASPGIFSTPSAVTVGTTATTILDVDVSRFDSIGFIIQNTGATALTSFTTLLRFHPSSFYNPKLVAAADYTTNAAINNGNATIIPMEASVSPVTLAGSNATSWIRLNTRGVESLRFTATVASGTTTLTLFGSGK